MFKKQNEEANSQEMASPEKRRKDSLDIENLKEIISKKLKDPEIAKKAAMIISDMAKDTAKSSKTSSKKKLKKAG
jgi:hypothetical protein